MARTYYPRARVVLQALIEDWRPFSKDGVSQSGQLIEEFFTFDVIPRDAVVERNDHRTADTAQIELDYRDFPFDPRTCRDCKVSVYMGDAGDPAVVFLPDDLEKYLIFQGHVDEPESSLDSAGEMVRIRCRDFTALFLDKHYVGPKPVKIDRPLSAVVQDFIDATPGADGMIIAFAAGADDVDLSKIKGRTKWAPKPGDDHWTILVELCGFAGLIPVVELGALRIVNAGEIERERATANFIYGENVAKLQFSRKINEFRTKQIQVTCWDEQARETRVGIYPTTPIVKKQKITKKGKLKTDDEAILPFFISGTASQADCVQVARRIYEEMARSEVEGSVETMDLKDLYEETTLPLVKSGDALTVFLGTTLASSIVGMSEAEAVAFLTAKPRNFPEAAATALARSWWQAGDAATTFYVKKATHRWNRDSGYRFEANFINYAIQVG